MVFLCYVCCTWLLLGNYQTAEGICEIAFFEESGGRFDSHSSYYNIYIAGLNISADGVEFSYLKEETVACKVTYLDATDPLVEIQSNRHIRFMRMCLF